MIKLELELSDLDFDALIDAYLPQIADQLQKAGHPIGAMLANGMPANMAKGMLQALSQEKKEQLAVSLLNSNKNKMIAAIENGSNQKGIKMHINRFDARQQ
jgi:glutamate-1-semialdehyde aminotransferase